MTAHPLTQALAMCAVRTPADRFTNREREEHLLFVTLATNAAEACSAVWLEHRKSRLIRCVQNAHQWLRRLGVTNPNRAFRAEYDRAVVKHPGMTLDQDAPTGLQRACALIEEVGEVARALTYDQGDQDQLITEVTQVGALAAAWLTHINKEAEK